MIRSGWVPSSKLSVHAKQANPDVGDRGICKIFHCHLVHETSSAAALLRFASHVSPDVQLSSRRAMYGCVAAHA